ncbi:MAG: arginine deiminase-related protein [Alphaproteobacteria bacterium]
MTQQKILMCAPDYFGVDYIINPWMVEGLGKTDAALVHAQWDTLKSALEKHVELTFVAPQKGLPDMVFTANAGMVLGKKAIVSRFRSKERQGEEPFFKKWFEDNGFEIVPWPQEIAFEGAGDALFDRGQPLIWAGYGLRSGQDSPPLLEKFFGRKAIAAHLVDPRFYHLDTCMCPLEGGYLMYFPQAFDEATQKTIAATVPEQKRIIVSEADALKFSCNAVDVNKHVFFNHASTDLQNQLQRAGFTPIVIALSEFMKSGGAAKCLTLKLVEA